MICVLVISFITILVQPVPVLSLRTGITSLIGLSNYYLLHTSSDYFAESSSYNPFLHTWSLSVEAQFYLIFSLIAVAFLFVSRADSHYFQSRAFFCFLLALSLASLLYFVFSYSASPHSFYFSIFSRFWELACGILTLCLLLRLRRQPHISTSIAVCLLLFIVACLLAPANYVLFSTPFVVFAVALLIATQSLGLIFSLSPIVFIGEISYSFYLWHWPMISLSRWIFGDKILPILVAALSSIVVAIFSFKLIEARRTRSKRLLAFLGLFSILVFITTWKPIATVSFSPIRFTRYPDEAFISVQKLLLNANDRGFSCSTISLVDCIRDESSSASILVFGDSHASNLVPSIREAFSKGNSNKVKFLTNVPSKNGLKWYQDNDLVNYLSSLDSSSILVWSRVYTSSLQEPKTTLSELSFLSSISQETGAKLLIVDDIPNFGGPEGFWPALSFFGEGPIISVQEARSQRSYHTQLIQKFTKLDTRTIFYLDPFAILCGESFCPSSFDGKLVYSDSSPHFNKFGSLLLTDMFKPFLD